VSGFDHSMSDCDHSFVNRLAFYDVGHCVVCAVRKKQYPAKDKA
jgi:hypothetical protein